MIQEKARGFAPGPQQRQSLCNPFLFGDGMGGNSLVATRVVAPHPIPKPSTGFQGRRPWRGQGAEPLAFLEHVP
jgi:hypothetical protein